MYHHEDIKGQVWSLHIVLKSKQMKVIMIRRKDTVFPDISDHVPTLLTFVFLNISLVQNHTISCKYMQVIITQPMVTGTTLTLHSSKVFHIWLTSVKIYFYLSVEKQWVGVRQEEKWSNLADFPNLQGSIHYTVHRFHS